MTFSGLPSVAMPWAFVLEQTPRGQNCQERQTTGTSGGTGWAPMFCKRLRTPSLAQGNLAATVLWGLSPWNGKNHRSPHISLFTWATRKPLTKAHFKMSEMLQLLPRPQKRVHHEVKSAPTF